MLIRERKVIVESYRWRMIGGVNNPKQKGKPSLFIGCIDWNGSWLLGGACVRACLHPTTVRCEFDVSGSSPA